MSGATPFLERALRAPIGSRLLLAPITRAAYAWYRRTDQTPMLGYRAMRKLFGSAAAPQFDRLEERARREQPLLELGSPTGIVRDQVEEIVGALERDGIAVLPRRLPEATCEALERIAATSPCTLTGPRPGSPEVAVFDAAAPLAVRYDVPESVLLESPVVQELLADRSVLAVAQSYLGSAPVQDLVAMWWSTESSTASSAAAQQFHFDLDRLRFLKLFVYLTEVTDQTGPHVFVRGSHQSLAPALREDRRFSDAEVRHHHPDEDIVSVTGGRGTMFLADTRGLHKGLNVESGHRLVFQLEYSSSLFGAPVITADIHAPAEALRLAATQFPATYRRLRLTS